MAALNDKSHNAINYIQYFSKAANSRAEITAENQRFHPAQLLVHKMIYQWKKNKNAN